LAVDHQNHLALAIAFVTTFVSAWAGGAVAATLTLEDDATYEPAKGILEIVATLRRHIPDDTYRFEPARDLSGRNVYRASLIRLENMEQLHAEALRAGHMDEVIAFAKGRSLERSEAMCQGLAEAASLGYERGRSAAEGGSSAAPDDPQEALHDYDARIALLEALLDEAGNSHFAAIVREELERADVARAGYFAARRQLAPEGDVRSLAERQRLVTRHRESKNANRHLLALADLYATLAREYVSARPPESLWFDPPVFQDLVDGAAKLYEVVANQEIALVDRKRRLRALTSATLLASLALGCAGSAALPAGTTLVAERSRSTRLPDDLDRATRDLLAVALIASQDHALAARDTLAVLEEERRAHGGPATGLLPYADHLVAAMSRDAIAYRAESLALLERDDLEPALREFLETQVEDDPLRLARVRISDSRKQKGARVFNAFASAAGRSALNLSMAPARLASAALKVAIAEHLEDPISVPERQALHHWKRYVETNPNAPETPEIVGRIESAQLRWFAMKRKRSLRAARKGLSLGQAEVAFLLADRALRYSIEDDEAQALRDEADQRLRAKRARRARTLAAPTALASVETGKQARVLAEALLRPGADLLGASEAVLASDAIALHPEARFAHAIALAEGGQEQHSWEEMGVVARAPGGIARHARGLVAQPVANPYGAFRDAIATDRKETVGKIVFGPLAGGPRDLELPRALEWMISAPTFIGTLGGIPQRLLQTAIQPPPSLRPAVHGYRYLRRHPEGEHAEEVRDWLVDHERSRENWVGAYQLALADPDEDEADLEELEERAAEQGLESAQRQERRDLKLHYLNEVALRFPDTEAGREARQQAFDQIHDAATQSIRISRGFLRENPRAAGPEGLGLPPPEWRHPGRRPRSRSRAARALGGRRRRAGSAAGAAFVGAPRTSCGATR
jgi:hypothetical protein